MPSNRATQILEAIAHNRESRDYVASMHLPYGAHCRAWIDFQLNLQLQQLLTLLSEHNNDDRNSLN